jgi:hypothetical protein
VQADGRDEGVKDDGVGGGSRESAGPDRQGRERIKSVLLQSEQQASSLFGFKMQVTLGWVECFAVLPAPASAASQRSYRDNLFGWQDARNVRVG